MGRAVAIEMFAATPKTVNPHAMATLFWKTSRAVTCAMKKNGVPVAFPVHLPDGQSPRMTFEETTTFTMTCAGLAGPAEKRASVTVRPPPEITTFTAIPPIVARDQAAALTWTTRNADACQLDPGEEKVAVNPTVPIEKKPRATTTYSLTCAGVGPDVAQSRTVVFSQVATMSFFVTPVVFAPDMRKKVTLSWRVTDASGNCILGLGNISVPGKDGTKTLPRAFATLYTLTCPGNGGPVTATPPPSKNSGVRHRTMFHEHSQEKMPFVEGHRCANLHIKRHSGRPYLRKIGFTQNTRRLSSNLPTLSPGMRRRR